MTVNRNKDTEIDAKKARSRKAEPDSQPGWANGLKQLYDEVVEEDIPDSFKDLLSKLDAAS